MQRLNSDILMRTLLKSGLLLTLIGLLTFFAVFHLVESKFEQAQKEESAKVSSLISNAIEATDNAADTYEKLIALRMYTLSKVIAKQLEGKSIAMITDAELSRIRDEWGLSDLSLFVKQEGDIVVAKSSDPKEIGLSSKDWGYWFTAFQQLFELQPVTVKEGLSSKHFWVGPLTKSVLYSKQFLYAYYYDGNTDYMINPYLSASEVQTFIDSFGPNHLIENMLKSSSDIVEIAVINVEPYLNEKPTEVVEPKKDLPILYGSHQMTLDEDYTVLSSVSSHGGQETVSFREKGRYFKKIFVSLSENRVLTIVMDVSNRNQTLYQILGIMIIVYVAAFLIIYIIASKMSKRSLVLIENINKLAYFDTLTGLSNRNHFLEYMKSTLETKKNTKFALFMIDFDNFKCINDTLGHAAGDRFLIAASDRLYKYINGNGFLARIGGDEFILVSQVNSQSEAANIARGLLSSFRDPFILEGNELFVSMSIGISLYPVDGEDIDSLMKCADIALYSEKYKEKNNFSFFNCI